MSGIEERGREQVAENIRELAQEADDPENWRVLIPEGEFDWVTSELEAQEDVGAQYEGISLCYTSRDSYPKVEYRAPLTEHLRSLHTGSDRDDVRSIGGGES